MKPDAKGIEEAARAAKKGRGPAPVHLWNPPFMGDIDMRIARDGSWYHEGGRINREALVKLFASILLREGENYFLVTPVEKVGIRVDDAPFVAVDFEASGQGQEQDLLFVTNVGDEVIAGPEHPIRVERDSETGEPSPYVMVRAGLEALIDRKSFYRLVELGRHEMRDDQSWFGLWSGGNFFPILLSAELTA